MKPIKFYNSNLSIWVVMFGLLAYFYPPSFLFAGKYINIFFAITMFGIGMVISEDDYKNITRSPR